MSNVLYPQLDLALQYETGGDLSNFMPNGEWSLIGEAILEQCFSEYNAMHTILPFTIPPPPACPLELQTNVHMEVRNQGEGSY